MGWLEEVLPRFSLQTKSFLLAYEFQQGHLDQGDVARFMDLLCATAAERTQLKDAVRKEAERLQLPLDVKVRLQESLSSGPAPAAAPAAAAGGAATARLPRTTAVFPPPDATGRPAQRPVSPPAKDKTSEIQLDRKTTRMLRKADAPKRSIDPRRRYVRRVLILDDDRRIALSLEPALSGAGFWIERVETVDLARRAMERERFCLVVMELKLPGTLGLELLEHLVGQGARMPVIVNSKVDVFKDDVLVSTYPQLRYFIKPSSTKEIVAAAEAIALQPGE